MDHSVHTRHSAVSKSSTKGETKRSQKMGLHSANERRQFWRQGPNICRQMMCPERQKAFKVLTHGSPYFAALSLELVSAPVEE